MRLRLSNSGHQRSGQRPRSSVQTLAHSEGRVTPLGDEPVGEIIVFVEDGYLSSFEYVSYSDPPTAEWPSLDRIEIIQV